MTHTIPIYNTRLEIEFDPHAPSKHGFNVHNKDTTCAVVYTNHETGLIVMAFKPERLDYGVVAHESVHAAYHILDHVGVQFDVCNHEAFAYLVGYLTELVWKDFRVYADRMIDDRILRDETRTKQIKEVAKDQVTQIGDSQKKD